MSATGAAVILAAPSAADRARVRPMVDATGVFRPDEVDVAVEVFDDAVARPGTDYHALGAYEDDRLVGFALFGRTPCTVATWDLYWIVVEPARHRGGVGRQLMTAAERVIAGYGGRLVVVETSSRDDYAPTRSFYESLHYDRAAEIAHYYAPDDHLIVYTKLLDPPDTVGHYG
jgi:ribosomal protein S18 acetylase RimI-like enzyme